MVNARILFTLCAFAFGFAGAASSERCDRASFGAFQQKDYKDTRARVLEAQADGPLTFRLAKSGKHIVVSGTWHDPYSGKWLVNVPASTVEIDHVVPVCWAWSHGADMWDRETRRAFYNDTRFLIAVEQYWNAHKGSMAPDRFMPINGAFACEYVTLFLEGVATYDLRLSATEVADFAMTFDAACGWKVPAIN